VGASRGEQGERAVKKNRKVTRALGFVWNSRDLSVPGNQRQKADR